MEAVKSILYLNKLAGDARVAKGLIRVSIGSAIAIGLEKGFLEAKPTTAYLLTYHPGRCASNCAFCPQARNSSSSLNMLSRVIWPPYDLSRVVVHLSQAFKKGIIKRVCVQALNYPKVFKDIMEVLRAVKDSEGTPISVSCQPLTEKQIKVLVDYGVDRIGIPLDAATEDCFNKVKGLNVKGLYRWEEHFKALKAALRFFGEGRVSTHLIVGLGEGEGEMVSMIQRLYDIGVYPALFAFTPIPGTAMESYPQPPIESYRRIQLAHYLITKGMVRLEEMIFDRGGVLKGLKVNINLERIVETEEPFLTSGCPHCNRPYYNERPKGPIYNFPRPLKRGEAEEIKGQMAPLLKP